MFEAMKFINLSKRHFISYQSFIKSG